MNRLKTLSCQFIDLKDGATSIEYALLGALIAVVIISAVSAIGANLNALFSNVASLVGSAIAGAL